MTPPDDHRTLRDARAAYFVRAGFSPDGGYGDKWVKLKLGKRTIFAFPNTEPRVRAVRFHDLHHVVTGYDTTWRGEAEIGAWELAAGCGPYVAAWVLNFGAALIGLIIAPRRVIQAFRRGRRSNTLYDRDFTDELLEMTVGEMRRQLRL